VIYRHNHNTSPTNTLWLQGKTSMNAQRNHKGLTDMRISGIVLIARASSKDTALKTSLAVSK
jgi:hypothetical protein